MERRRALELITAAAVAATILPGCDFTNIPKFTNLNINKSNYRMVAELSDMILPIPEEMILANLSPGQFVLTMINDCNTAEDIEKFTAGMLAINEGWAKDIKKHEAPLEQLQMIIEGQDVDNNQADEKAYFLQKLKSYNVQYYKGLEEYLSTYTDWEFVPSRFSGCVAV